MKPIDYAKAVGVSLLLIVLFILISIVIMVVYSFMIEPGHPNEFYNAAAQRIVPKWLHVIEPGFFFAAGYFCGKRRPKRNAYAFAAAFCAAYVVLDAAMVVPSGGVADFFRAGTILCLVVGFASAFAGAFLATVRRIKTE